MQQLRFMTASESHGPCLTGILEGMPAGLPLTEDDLATDLARRQVGYGRGGRMKIEQDRAELLGGVAKGLTTGGPIALRIENRDWANWKDKNPEPLTVPRPGHADLAGIMKYLLDDMRIVLERASARETAMRVAVGGICKKLLREFGIVIHSQVIQIGDVRTEPVTDLTPEVIERLEASSLRVYDPAAEEAMRNAILEARRAGDTLGGIFEVRATNIPVGLGSHVQWDRRLDGRLAQAILSINAVKAVEIGDGWENAGRRGTQAHDQIYLRDGRLVRGSNHAGGLEGGITNGEPIVVRGAMKPISTTPTPQASVDMKTGMPSPSQYQRSDTCAVPAAGVIGEAMVAFVLADAFLEKFGGDSLREIRASYEQYQRDLARYLHPQSV